MIFWDDEPRYRKRRKSNVSKARKKTKHEHKYEPCFLEYTYIVNKENTYYSKANYCTICGKIGDASLIPYKQMNEEYPVFKVKDIFQEKVELDVNNNLGGEDESV